MNNEKYCDHWISCLQNILSHVWFMTPTIKSPHSVDQKINFYSRNNVLHLYWFIFTRDIDITNAINEIVPPFTITVFVQKLIKNVL